MFFFVGMFTEVTGRGRFFYGGDMVGGSGDYSMMKIVFEGKIIRKLNDE